MKARKLHVESLEDRQMMATLYPGLSVADVTVNEGAKTVTAVITRNNTGYLTGTVDWSLKPGTAGTADYRNASGRVTFAPSETSKPITIAITDDLLAEATEEFSIVLKNPKWGKIVDGTALVNIVDNDKATPPPDPDPPTDPPTDPPPSTGARGPQQVSAPAGAIIATSLYQVNAAPAGATIYLKAGVYTGSLSPKDNQTIIGEFGATLRDTINRAIFATGRGVKISNLIIDGYRPTSEWFASVHVGQDWVLDNFEIRNSSIGGIFVEGDRAVVSDSYVHHNQRIGVKTDGTLGVKFLNNEVAYNNADRRWDPGVEAGGSKFWDSDGLLLDGNFFHHNYGHGIWFDYNNRNAIVRGNTASDNAMSGIYQEIGGSMLIENNLTERNGLSLFNAPDWPESAGIFVNTSHDVTIRNNVSRDNRYGIAIVHYSRGSQYWTANMLVSGNTLSGNIKGSGVWDVPSGSVTWDGVKLGSNFRLAR